MSEAEEIKAIEDVMHVAAIEDAFISILARLQLIAKSGRSRVLTVSDINKAILEITKENGPLHDLRKACEGD